MIAANNGYLLAFDNLSCLSHCLPDALCRPATGGSFGDQGATSGAQRRVQTVLTVLTQEPLFPVIISFSILGSANAPNPGSADDVG